MDSFHREAADQFRVIYDVGANNGDDIPYYLKKAHRVVAIEANPDLCRHMRARFAAEVSDGRLIVEHCALMADCTNTMVPLYVHTLNHVKSLVQRPHVDALRHYREVSVPSRSFLSILQEHGDPYYVKLDIEGQDVAVLRQLFAAGIKPPFISAESHSIEVLSVMIASGGYDAFKVVVGSSVARQFRNHGISTLAGRDTHSFPPHSAGPFGDDLPGDWMPGDLFFQQLAITGLGWKDVHATSAFEPNRHARLSIWPHVTRRLARRCGLSRMKSRLPAFVRRARRFFTPGRPPHAAQGRPIQSRSFGE
ncbi:MAG: FkbM family methyltransferase [Planctomycetia bacterium]